MVGGGVKSVKVSKVSLILEITSTVASFDTYEGSVKSSKSVKCVQIVILRRWLNEDAWETGGQKFQKQNIGNYRYYSLFSHL